MLPHHFLKKFQGRRSLIISVIQIHILLLLLIGIIFFMGSLKRNGGTPFSLFFSAPETVENSPSEQSPERKARILLPVKNTSTSKPGKSPK